MSGRRRRTGVLAVGLAVGVALTGCAPVTPGGWRPPEWDVAGLEVVDAVPAAVEAASLDMLTPRRLRNDATRIQARFVHLPGTGDRVRGFNTAVDDIVGAAVSDASARSGVAYTPAVQSSGMSERACVAGSTTQDAAAILADPDLGVPDGTGVALVCDIVVASGPFLGERLRVIAGEDGEPVDDRSRILYVDTSTGDYTAGDGLWVQSAPDTLSAEIIELLRRDAGALSLARPTHADDDQLARIRGALADAIPDGYGGFLVTVAPGFTSPELRGLGIQATTDPLQIRVPADLAAPLLTGFGRRLLAASGSDPELPAAVAAGREWLDCDLLPCVALTYDDGPSGLTPTLLDTLAERRAAATFFMLGTSASDYPETVRRVSDEGHSIGNHTWNHPSLPSLDDAQIRDQLTRTGELLRRLSGQRVSTFRPPYGEIDSRVLAAAQMPAILWTVDTRDWAGPEDDVLIDRAVQQPGPGGIVLFHDIHERSVRVAGATIDGLRDRGFVMATLTQLFDGDPPTGGEWRGAP